MDGIMDYSEKATNAHEQALEVESIFAILINFTETWLRSVQVQEQVPQPLLPGQAMETNLQKSQHLLSLVWELPHLPCNLVNPITTAFIIAQLRWGASVPFS
jgi:hypothetical protein